MNRSARHVASGARRFFPRIADLYRMFKFQTRRTDGCGVLTGSLCNDRVTGVAVIADDLAGLAGVLAIVASEATGKILVPDVVRVHAPVHLHVRKKIVRINGLCFADRLREQPRLALGKSRLFGFIVGLEFFGYRAQRFVRSLVVLRQSLNNLLFDVRNALVDTAGTDR